MVLQSFCRVLSELHDKAPVHKWEASKAAIEKAFGLPVEQMFESIDHSAIASGSIAQVRSQPLLLCPKPGCVNSSFRLACCALGALATLPMACWQPCTHTATPLVLFFQGHVFTLSQGTTRPAHT